jgi:succinate dehydrogenase cytochrome b556 subunit
MYAPQITSMMSIFHRISGAFLGLSFLAGILGAYIGTQTLSYYPVYACVVLLGSLPAGVWVSYALLVCAGISYHMWNGVRHLVWDTGAGLSLEKVHSSAHLVGLAGACTFVILCVRLFA